MSGWPVMPGPGIKSSQQEQTLPVTTGLVLHLEADAGVSETSGTVDSWTDQSPTGLVLTKEGDPQIVTESALNNQPVISFDGTDDALSILSGLTGLPTLSADRSMFVVVKYDSVGYGGVVYGEAINNQCFGLSVKDDGYLMVQGWGPGDAVTTTMGNGEGWLLQCAILDSNSLKQYKDGVLINTVTHTYNTILSLMRIGTELSASTSLVMKVAAVLIYDDALSDTDRASVEAYLQNKYDL